MALIALVQAGIEPLPDIAAARRLKEADIELRKMLARERKAASRTTPALKYSPDQPRVPAGNPTGGQWTTEDGAEGSSSGSDGQRAAPADASIASDAMQTSANPAAAGDTDSVDWNFIGQQEGSSLDGYTVKGNDGVPSPNSGVTVGTGIDLGSRNQSDLDQLGLPDELEAKLEPYLGLKGSDAQDKLDSDPLTLTQAEADALTQAVQTHDLNTLRNAYNDAVGPMGVQFDDLPPPEAQTAIADVATQWGPTFGTKGNSYAQQFWQAATEQDWVEAESVLREWAPQAYNGTSFANRRNAEADLLGRLY